MSTLHVEHSRAIPAVVEATYDLALTHPITELLARRYLAFPPVRAVRDQDEPWGAAVGQSRTIEAADGGTMVETLTLVDRPAAFGYRLTQITGPMMAIVAAVDGRWTFEPAGTGTRVSWAWEIEPKSSVAGYLLPALGRMWRGYARQALEELERIALVTAPSTPAPRETETV